MLERKEEISHQKPNPSAVTGQALRSAFHDLIKEEVSGCIPDWIARCLVSLSEGQVTICLLPATSDLDQRLPALKKKLASGLALPLPVNVDVHRHEEGFLAASASVPLENLVFHMKGKPRRDPTKTAAVSASWRRVGNDQLSLDVARTLPPDVELINLTRYRIPLEGGKLDLLSPRVVVPENAEAKLSDWREEFERRHGIHVSIERSDVLSDMREQLLEWSGGNDLITKANLPQIEKHLRTLYGSPPPAPTGDIVPAGLRDLSALPWVAIDSLSTKGMEDVLYCEASNIPGALKLMVGIIDVTSYIAPGDDVDEYAQKVGTSIFAGEVAIPTLGLDIAYGAASFKTGEDRPAWIIELDIDPVGRVLSSTVSRAKVKSHAQLAPEQVVERFAKGYKGPPNLQLLQEAASRLHAARMQQHKILRIDGEDGGHVIVSEAMMAAKIATGRFVAARTDGIFRVQSPLTQEWKEVLSERLGAVGIIFKPADFENPATLGGLLKELEVGCGAERAILREILDGIIPRSRSDVVNRGHLSVGADAYMNLKPRDAEGIANQFQLRSIVDSAFPPLTLVELRRRASRRNRQRHEMESLEYKVRLFERLKRSLPLEGHTMDATVVGSGKNGMLIAVPGFSEQASLRRKPVLPASYPPGQMIPVTLDGFSISCKGFTFSLVA